MCNCGNKRNDYTKAQSFKLSNGRIEPQKNNMWPDTYFEYIGKTALSVTGNITGKRYRFNQQGDKQLVDYRDASGMMAVTVLRKVPK